MIPDLSTYTVADLQGAISRQAVADGIPLTTCRLKCGRLSKGGVCGWCLQAEMDRREYRDNRPTPIDGFEAKR